MNLATIETINNVRHHPNAERLDLANVLGFQVVVGRDDFTEGQPVVFIQPDSVLPIELWTEAIRKYVPNRVKAVRLRNEWSEGLVVDIESTPIDSLLLLNVGTDVTEELGIQKYEPALKFVNNTQAKGGLPFDIPKTDEVRFENLRDIPYGIFVDVTLKIDGQSGTFYYDLDSDQFGVCSRTQELRDDIDSNYHRVAYKYDLYNKLRNYCIENGVSLALRGEVYGKGIQSFEKNPHAKLNQDFAVFSVWNIKERRYENVNDRFYFLNVCEELSLPSVPLLGREVLTPELISYYRDAESLEGEPFEGAVIKSGNGSFKVINRNYDSNK